MSSKIRGRRAWQWTDKFVTLPEKNTCLYVFRIFAFYVHILQLIGTPSIQYYCFHSLYNDLIENNA